LRYHLLEGTNVLFPGRLWIFGLADAGRVWVDDEDSDEWHPSYGGGVVVEMLATPLKMTVEVARNDDEDDLNFYFRTGFAF
jgi:outer membrane protein assembly factor BamA